MMRKKYLIFALLLALVCTGGVLVPKVSASAAWGNFHGKFFYDNGSSGRFHGTLYRQGSRIWGTCIDQDGSESNLSGKVNGDSVNFIKIYEDNHRVQYSGTYYDDSNMIKGHWRINQNNIGTFFIKMDD